MRPHKNNWWVMKIYEWELLPVCHPLASLVTIDILIVEMFLTSDVIDFTWIHV